MPKVKWHGNAKLTNLALGLKSDVDRASIPVRVKEGDEVELTDAMVEALQRVHGEDAFTVVGGKKKAAAKEKE